MNAGRDIRLIPAGALIHGEIADSSGGGTSQNQPSGLCVGGGAVCSIVVWMLGVLW